MKTNFHKENFTLRLILKRRETSTRKWLIAKLTEKPDLMSVIVTARRLPVQEPPQELQSTAPWIEEDDQEFLSEQQHRGSSPLKRVSSGSPQR